MLSKKYLRLYLVLASLHQLTARSGRDIVLAGSDHAAHCTANSAMGVCSVYCLCRVVQKGSEATAGVG